MAAAWTCARLLRATRHASRRCPSRRRRSLPTCPRTCWTRPRCISCWIWRASAAWRPGATRCWPARASTSPRAGRYCTPRCGRRAGPHPSAMRCTPRWTPCWPLLTRCGPRRRVASAALAGRLAPVPSPTSSTSASAARTSARAWPWPRWTPSRKTARACTSSAMWTGTTSRRCCAVWTPGARSSSWPARPSPRRRPWPTPMRRATGSMPKAALTAPRTSWA